MNRGKKEMRERNIGYLHETLRAFETGVYETENGKAEVPVPVR